MDSLPFTSQLSPELRVSTPAMAVSLIAAGTLLAFTAEFSSADIQSSAIGLTTIALGAAVWLLARAQARFARLILVIGVQVVVLLAAAWLRNPLVLGLLAVPPAVAAVASGLGTAVITGTVETILLPTILTYAGLPRNLFALIVGALSIWMVAFIVLGSQRHIGQRGRWLSDYYETMRRELEEARDHEVELRQTHQERGNAIRQLAIANQRLAALRAVAEDASKSKAAFVAEVSHEFRTPLNIIIGMVSLMVEAPDIYDGEFPEHAMEQLRVVYDNCRHLTAMIDDVLDLSRVEVGRMTLHREEVDLSETLLATLAAVRPLITEKDLQLRVSVADDLPRVVCDPTRIRQIILNLLSNATRMTDEGGITVGLAQGDGKVRISVADTGPGIAPEDTEAIFEPFQQGRRRTWRDSRGAGLGLSLSRSFVQLHGGSMWFESEIGRGTTFFVELPISDPREHAVRPDRWIKPDWAWREQSFHTQDADRGGRQASRRRVLVVDESGGLASELDRHADQAQYVVAESVSGAVRELDVCPAHAAILNAQSIEEILPMIEDARERMPETPLIGCFCPPRSARSRAAGALDYLVKPVLQSDLARAIGAAATPVRQVLIVDDEADARDLLASYVRAIDSAIEVVEAPGGEEALRLLRAGGPDLVLLDVVMPELSGWDVLAIKADDAAIQGVPVIMVSAQDARDAPASTPVLVATQGPGLPIAKLLDCSAHFSELLLRPQ